PDFSVKILNSLKEANLTPDLIITNPDEPKGRKLILTPPPIKVWAEKNKIKYIQPNSLKIVPEELKSCFDLFIVAAYGKLIPQAVLDLPKHGTLNVHPSLLPKYRGASPIQSAILNGDEETGTSIMLLDAGLDSGPVLAQEKLSLANWSPTFLELLDKLADISGKLLVKTIPKWLDGEIRAIDQNHTLATFCKKIEKKFGFIPAEDILSPDLPIEKVYEIERKIRALNPDPGTFTIIKSKGKETRVKITKAKIADKKLIIEKVIPEGKKEMAWEDWKRGNL
ncbi:MAG: methionyl-tRNA formyltransferase, partial [Patescibacteria group bacterium]